MGNKKILVANWKAHIQNLITVENRIEGINILLAKSENIIICPPFLYLKMLIDEIENDEILIGSQNLPITESEASTGEILAPMQVDIGCRYAIIGHSEVRRNYKESDDIVATKARIALEYGIIPIICIGESLEIRNSGQYLQFLTGQLIRSLPSVKGISNIRNIGNRMIIAYEPIWSIGTGNIPNVAQIEEVITTLKSLPEAKEYPFIYGGSVNEYNIEDINFTYMLDGVLVGRASTDVNKLAIIRQLLD